MSLIKKHINIGLNREEIVHQEIWEIPKAALREALINAIVHTDYSIEVLQFGCLFLIIELK